VRVISDQLRVLSETAPFLLYAFDPYFTGLKATEEKVMSEENNELEEKERPMVAYARVSTEDQLLDLQINALEKAGVPSERIYREQVSGAKTKRPILAECLRSLRDGDVLVVWRLDRLGRSVPELIKIMDELEKRNIGFRSLSESIDTTTAAGRMVFHMLAAFAEFERNLISERTRAGLKAARHRGHKGGRKPVMNAKMTKAAKAMLTDPTTTMQEVADTLKVSRTAVYNALKREGLPAKAKALKKAVGRAERHIESLEKPDNE